MVNTAQLVLVLIAHGELKASAANPSPGTGNFYLVMRIGSQNANYINPFISNALRIGFDIGPRFAPLSLGRRSPQGMHFICGGFMQTFLTKKRMTAQAERPSSMLDEWQTPEPLILPRLDVSTITEARAVLGEAERTIRAQEKRIRQLENIALTDELTGLLNRRGFLKAFQRELAAAGREAKAHGVLIMVDLDGFKSINDLWGHAAGDDYLQTVAHALLSDVRATDVVSRIGGDEFAVLITRIDETAGVARMHVLEKSFNSRMMQWDRKPLPLRASFGLAPYKANDAPETIMEAADLKLYAHKARRARR